MENEVLVRLETKFEQLIETVNDIREAINLQNSKLQSIEKDIIVLEQKHIENEQRINELKEYHKQNKNWLLGITASIISGIIVTLIRFFTGI